MALAMTSMNYTMPSSEADVARAVDQTGATRGGAQPAMAGLQSRGASNALSDYLECVTQNLEGQVELIRRAIDLHPDLTPSANSRTAVDNATRPFYKAHEKLKSDMKDMAQVFRRAERNGQGASQTASPEEAVRKGPFEQGRSRDLSERVSSVRLPAKAADEEDPAAAERQRKGKLSAQGTTVSFNLPFYDGPDEDADDNHNDHQDATGPSDRTSQPKETSPSPKLTKAGTRPLRRSLVKKIFSVTSESPKTLSETLEGKSWLEGFIAFSRWIVRHRRFEMFFAVIISLNAMVMAVEAEYVGSIMSRDASTWGEVSPTRAEEWPAGQGSTRNIFDALEWFFGVLFTIELVLKIVACSMDFWIDWWSYLDLLVVITWMITIPASVEGGEADSGEGINATWIRLLRLGRLFRLVKLMKTIKGMDALVLMFTALESGTNTLNWAIILLFTAQLFFALFINQVLRVTFFNDSSNSAAAKEEVYIYFGTCSRALLSMFEVTLANWPPICRAMQERVDQWWSLFFVLHKLVIGFAVVGIINGVFMQETFKVAGMDDRIMMRQKEKARDVHAKKMRMFFELADEDGSGQLSQQEFRDFAMRPEIRTWLSAMDLDVRDVDNLWSLIDDGDGQVTVEELIKGVSRLKGNARAIDLAVLSEKKLPEIARLVRGIEALAELPMQMEALALAQLPNQMQRLVEFPAQKPASPRLTSYEI